MFDSGTLFLKKEQVIGTFTIHLAEHMVNSKRALLSKLLLLQEHLRQKHEGEWNELVRKVSIISNRIRASLQSYESNTTVKAGSLNVSEKERADRLRRLGLLRRVIKNHSYQERTADSPVAILQAAIRQDKVETAQLNIKTSLLQSNDIGPQCGDPVQHPARIAAQVGAKAGADIPGSQTEAGL